MGLVIMSPDHESIDSIAQQAQRAEVGGFEFVSMGETTGWNIASVLSYVAANTEKIGLTNDAMDPFSRSPALLAQTALTLQEATDGHYRLGLGASSGQLVENWHGGEFNRPLRRLRETIEIVREISTGDRVEYDGEIFTLNDLAYDTKISHGAPPVDIGSLGPKSVELTGRFADGWAPQLFTIDGLTNRLTDLERGAELGNRDIDDIRVTPLVRCFVDDKNPDHAKDLARQTVAFLIGAYGPYYGDSIAAQGYGDVVESARAAWQNRDTSSMTEAITDDLLDELVAAGTTEDVHSFIRRFASMDEVSAIRAGFVSNMAQSEKETTLNALSELI